MSQEAIGNIIIPIVAVLVGAGITYWLNVRQRRRNLVDDYFNEAMAAVSVAASRTSYLWRGDKWHPKVSDKEQIEFEKEVHREGTLRYFLAVGVARDAVAKCLPYRPSLSRYLEDSAASYFRDQPETIIAELREGPS